MSAVTEHWARLVKRHWQTSAVLRTLPGEQDLNFLVDPVDDQPPDVSSAAPGQAAVLKVMHRNCERSSVELQVALLSVLAGSDDLRVPQVLPASNGDPVITVVDTDGHARLAWMISRVPGVVLAHRLERSPALLKQIGHALAGIHLALKSFDHPELHRRFKWDLREAGWIAAHLALIDVPERRTTIAGLLQRFQNTVGPWLERQPVQAIHNDLNDHNILLIEDEQGQAQLGGVIDFGDAQAAPVLADVAIAAAYLMLDVEQPVEHVAWFVEGYCAKRPLSEAEVAAIWPLATTRLAVSVVNSKIEKIKRPDDPNVVVSEMPAWRLLDQLSAIDEHYVSVRLRRAAALSPDHRLDAVHRFLEQRRGSFAAMMGQSLESAVVLDLSPAGAESPVNPFELDSAALTGQIADASGASGISLGRYREPRLIYGSPAFRQQRHHASRRRSVHMGVDVFMPAGTVVRAPLAGKVCHAACYDAPQDYGGLVVLEHEVPGSGEAFFTLYGHLTHHSAQALSMGQQLAEGEAFAALGAEHDNGGWPPHLHLQLGVLKAGDYCWDGVVDADQLEDWCAVFPNPAALLNLSDAMLKAPLPDVSALQKERRSVTARNQKTSYQEPLSLVRGWRQFLFDESGRCYLDVYNNVPHVGHAHPQVVAAVSRQWQMLNTNTRYLHPLLAQYAKALTSRLPEHLSVCFLVNSGSEANELAVRLARRFTGADDVVVSADGYHGITNLGVDISHYKFAGKGGDGQKPWVHVAPVPDVYRGPYRGRDAGVQYAEVVRQLLQGMESEGRRACGFISEAFPSVGGQIVPPAGYLAAVYEHVHAHGGLAIADEVQTGLGRLGRYQWGFEQQRARPDIVVMGKPIGNGHPLGAVVTTRAIADAFDTGMELFSTFGGSTVSCAAGLAVLRVLDRENLADNAATVGAHLLEGLGQLADRFPVVGDVRGLGLFIGVELVKPDGSPATRVARRVVNVLRQHRVLIGSDGPFDNVLKIRPPLCFNRDDADYLLYMLERVLTDIQRCA